MKSGVEQILEERIRQQSVEKFDYLHDSSYKHGELMGAAGAYLANAMNQDDRSPSARFQVLTEPRGVLCFMPCPEWMDSWPWEKEWDKREKHNKRRSLQISAALIAAELDNMDYEESQTKPDYTKPMSDKPLKRCPEIGSREVSRREVSEPGREIQNDSRDRVRGEGGQDSLLGRSSDNEDKQ